MIWISFIEEATSITIHDCPDQLIIRPLRQGQTAMFVTWTEPWATNDVTGEKVSTLLPQYEPANTLFPIGETEVCYYFYDDNINMQYSESCCFIVYIIDPEAGYGE